MHHMRLLLQAVKLNLLKIEDQFCLASNGNMWTLLANSYTLAPHKVASTLVSSSSCHMYL